MQFGLWITVAVSVETHRRKLGITAQSLWRAVDNPFKKPGMAGFLLWITNS
jgi:hypothetical protein